MTFHADFDGHAEEVFDTLQSAMAWAEDLGDEQTGDISFQGVPIIVYARGRISAPETTYPA